MQRIIFILAILAGCCHFSQVRAQQVAVKSNLLYDGTTSMNLGLEVVMSPHWTLELPVNYNPWTFSDNRKLKHWMIQPEARYWFCEQFNAHFLGLHAHIAGFNAGGIDWLGMEKYRYEGTLYGGGLSYGYHWILSRHWSVEATLGLGYAYLDYTRYGCKVCDAPTTEQPSPTHYFGPTKAGITLIYVIK